MKGGEKLISVSHTSNYGCRNSNKILLNVFECSFEKIVESDFEFLL
jgi:hypothetical protein